MNTKKLFLGLILSLVVLSCSKDEETTPTAVNEVTIDNQIDNAADDVSNIIENQVDIIGSMNNKNSEEPENILPLCATATFTINQELNSWRKVITFQNCKLPNGNTLNGKLIIEGSFNTETPEKVIHYAFENFYHNGVKVEGNKTVTFSMESTEILETIHPVADMELELTLTFPNSTIYHRIGHKTREMIEGFTTKIWSDNKFAITGNWTTTSSKGTRSAVITSPLIIQAGCHNIVSGTILFTKDDKESTLDFGNGICDNIATLTVNGVSTEIKLKH